MNVGVRAVLCSDEPPISLPFMDLARGLCRETLSKNKRGQKAEPPLRLESGSFAIPAPTFWALRFFGGLFSDIAEPSMGNRPAEDSGPRKGRMRPDTSEVQSGGEAVAWDSILLCDTRDSPSFSKAGGATIGGRGSCPALSLPSLAFPPPSFPLFRCPRRETSHFVRMWPFSRFRYRRRGVVSSSAPVRPCLV